MITMPEVRDEMLPDRAGRVVSFRRDPFALAFLAVVTPDRED